MTNRTLHGLWPHLSADRSRLERANLGSVDHTGWRRTLRAALLALALPLAGLSSVHAQNEAQPRLPTVQIQAGMHLIKAEVADSPESRTAGLMFRERLGPNEGMLFAFPEPAVHCFWMKNTRIPLTIAFIDDTGQIANLADMQPFDESSHCAARAVRFTLEMEQGWFTKHGIKAGASLSNPQIFRAAAVKK